MVSYNSMRILPVNHLRKICIPRASCKASKGWVTKSLQLPALIFRTTKNLARWMQEAWSAYGKKFTAGTSTQGKRVAVHDDDCMTIKMS